MKEMRGFSSHVGVPRRRGSGAEGCAAPSSYPAPSHRGYRKRAPSLQEVQTSYRPD